LVVPDLKTDVHQLADGLVGKIGKAFESGPIQRKNIDFVRNVLKRRIV
jgi:hypothetical protein